MYINTLMNTESEISKLKAEIISLNAQSPDSTQVRTYIHTLLLVLGTTTRASLKKKKFFLNLKF
jgi:hypothetical protein